jgi:hypothetical protein
VIAGLLVAATIFFVWGALAERSNHNDTHATTATHQEGGGGESAGEHATEGGATESFSEYHPLGVDLESTPLIVVAAAVSLTLAGLVAFRPSTAAFVAVVVLGGAFTALEIAEVFHQADRDEIGLLALALVAAALHAAAAALALRALIVTPAAPSSS